MLKKKSAYKTFPDGTASVYKVIDRKLTELKAENIHFCEETVGERRFWDAKVSGTTIERTISIPEAVPAERGDILLILGQQYEIVQKDRKTTLPASWLLSLRKPVIEFKRLADE